MEDTESRGGGYLLLGAGKLTTELCRVIRSQCPGLLEVLEGE